MNTFYIVNYLICLFLTVFVECCRKSERLAQCPVSLGTCTSGTPGGHLVTITYTCTFTCTCTIISPAHLYMCLVQLVTVICTADTPASIDGRLVTVNTLVPLHKYVHIFKLYIKTMML